MAEINSISDNSDSPDNPQERRERIKNASHAYNSQIFNYEMIRDLIDEVKEETMGSESQLILLSNKIHDLNVRYHRAVRKGKRSLAYSLQLQMVTIKGVKCMYEEYRGRKKNKLDRLRSYAM